MRTCDQTLVVLLIGLGLGLAPALGFDGPPNGNRAQLQSLPPATAPFRAGNPKLVPSDRITTLQYQAEQGVPAAQWQLGYMYANGDGVPRNDLRAFNYYEKVANRQHGEDSLDRSIVANAIVAVGQYYLDGIPDSDVKADPARARKMFWHAATYFGDPEAQYRLAKLILDSGNPHDAVQAARWLKLAANKDQHSAQALLGEMLIKGEIVPRQSARGLMYLILAQEGAPDEAWINNLYKQGVAKATNDDLTAAKIYLEQWVRGLRD